MSFLGRRPVAIAIAAASSLFLALPLLASCSNTVDEQPSGSATGSTATGTTGTGGDSSTTGVGGAGGAEGCVPGTLLECYSGPAGTEGIGVCHGGAKKCAPDGVSFGACQWEVVPTPEDCTTAADEDCDGQTPACAGATLWSASYPADGTQYAQRVAIDPAGNLIVIGGYVGTWMLGGSLLSTVGQDDFFVAKFDPTGKPLWAKGYGSTAKDYAVDVAADPQGNIVITGSVGGNVDLGDGPLAGFGEDDIFLLKLDPQGNFLWRKMLGSPTSDFGYGVAVDSAGNVITTGMFNGTIDFGTGSLTSPGAASDIYIAKYDPMGAPIWVKQFGGMYGDYGSAVAVNAADEVLVTGGFYGPVDFGTGPLVTTGSYDGFVAKFDPAGKAIWAAQMKGGAGMGNYPVSLGITADGVVSGYFKGKVDLGGGELTSAGGTDVFLVKYDAATGKHVFSQRFGSSYVYPGQPTYVTDGAFAVATDPAGNIMLTGAYIDTIDFGGGPLGKEPYGDMFLARFDPTGKHLFSKNWGTAASYASGMGVAITKAGNTILAGYFVGTIDFGKGPLSTATPQDTDLFLVELSP